MPPPEFIDALYLVRGFEEALCNLPGGRAAEVVNARLDDDVVLRGGYWDDRVARGKQEVRECYRSWSEAFPTRHMRIHAAFGVPYGHGSNDAAWGYNICVRWTFLGINEGLINGMRPTGRRVKVSGMSMYRVRAADGAIIESIRAWDTASFLRSLGMNVQFPAVSLVDTVANAIGAGPAAAADTSAPPSPDTTTNSAASSSAAIGDTANGATELPPHARVPSHVGRVTQPAALAALPPGDRAAHVHALPTPQEATAAQAADVERRTWSGPRRWIASIFSTRNRRKSSNASTPDNVRGATGGTAGAVMIAPATGAAAPGVMPAPNIGNDTADQANADSSNAPLPVQERPTRANARVDNSMNALGVTQQQQPLTQGVANVDDEQAAQRANQDDERVRRETSSDASDNSVGFAAEAPPPSSTPVAGSSPGQGMRKSVGFPPNSKGNWEHLNRTAFIPA